MSQLSQKECSKCKETKPVSGFYKDSTKSTGLSSNCKDCQREQSKLYYQNNRDEILRKEKERNKENPMRPVNLYPSLGLDSVRTCNKCGETQTVKDFPKNRYSSDGYKSVCKKCQQETKKNCVENNKELYRETARKYQLRRYHEKPEVKISTIMRNLLNRSRHGIKLESTAKTLGYSPEKLIEKLEYQFTEGMCWEKMGEEIHIDHKIPIDHFLKKGETRVEVINAVANLQPLWAEENISKGNKYGS